MTQTTLPVPLDPEITPKAPAPGKSVRFGGLRRIVIAVRQAHGVPKFMLWTGAVLTALFVITAVFAPLIAPYNFDTYQADGKNFPKQGAPDGDHWFGTTVQSLDVVSRTVYGARTALEVMVLAVVFSLVLGVLLGLLSGYFGGWLDRILVLVMDALFAFPYLLLAIVTGFVFSGITGGGVVTAALSITVVYIPQYFRVVRASALSAREATFVEAARAMGAKPSVVIRKYLFGNVIQSVPVIGTMNAADAIGTLAGLGFLGLGIQPTDAAEWGYDLDRAIDDVNAGMWWTTVYPGAAMVIAILGFTLLGEGLNDVLNPTMRRRRITKVLLPAFSRRRVVTAPGAVDVPAQAVASKPLAAEPVTAEPVTAEPVASKSLASKPVTAEPVTAKAVTPDTATAEAATAESAEEGEAAK